MPLRMNHKYCVIVIQMNRQNGRGKIQEVLALMDVTIAHSLHAVSLRHRGGSSVVQL